MYIPKVLIYLYTDIYIHIPSRAAEFQAPLVRCTVTTKTHFGLAEVTAAHGQLPSVR